MSEALDTVAAILTSNRCDKQSSDWSALRYQHTAAVRSVLADLYAPATANKMLAALRGVLREAWRLGLVSAEEYHRAADLPSVRGTTAPRGRALAEDELAQLFARCVLDKSPAGVRDAAILAVLYASAQRLVATLLRRSCLGLNGGVGVDNHPYTAEVTPNVVIIVAPSAAVGTSGIVGIRVVLIAVRIGET
jgi:site-specific recombinase XerC